MDEGEGDPGTDPSKQEQLQRLVLKKRKCEKAAQEIVEHCVMNEFAISREYLLEKAVQITQNHLHDMMQERRISGICGWVLCPKRLVSIPNQKYSIRGNKVLDITERKNFCSPHCYTIYLHFKSQIPTSPLWLRDEEPAPEFTILEPYQIEDREAIHGVTLSFNSTDSDKANEEFHNVTLFNFNQDSQPRMSYSGKMGHNSSRNQTSDNGSPERKRSRMDVSDGNAGQQQDQNQLQVPPQDEADGNGTEAAGTNKRSLPMSVDDDTAEDGQGAPKAQKLDNDGSEGGRSEHANPLYLDENKKLKDLYKERLSRTGAPDLYEGANKLNGSPSWEWFQKQ